MQNVIRQLFVSTLLLLSFFSRHSNARDVHVYGVVSDSSGNPIQGAAIRIKGTAFSDTTDRQGAYDIQSTSISACKKAPAQNIPAIHIHGSNLTFTLSGPRRIELSWFTIAGRILARTQLECKQGGAYSLRLVAPASALQMYILQVHLETTVKNFRIVRGMSDPVTGKNFSYVHSNTEASVVTTETGALHKNTTVDKDTLTAFERGCRFEMIPLTSNDMEVNITLVFCGTNSWASWPMPNPATTGLPNPAHYTDLGDGTVRDEVTGLLWQKNASTRTYTYEEALAYSESLGNGWRLPKRIELLSLFDYTRTSPAIDNSVFPTPSNFFVTSSPWILTVTDPSRPRYAWVVNFYASSEEFVGGFR